MIRRLGFEEESTPYNSGTQTAKFWSEGWVSRELYCLNCGAARLSKFPNNRPVADFFCATCREEYEIKSHSGAIGVRIVNGAYGAMIERLSSDNNPNLVILGYSKQRQHVTSLAVIPRQFFVPSVIERRKPLAPTAKRAGWTGCNILLGQIPEAGKVVVVRDGILTPRETVLEQWRQVRFLRDESMAARGWLIEVMKCVEAIKRPEFELVDVYAFEGHLSRLYPDNKHVREKVRQQLQVLRDGGFIEFLGRGRYRRSLP